MITRKTVEAISLAAFIFISGCEKSRQDRAAQRETLVQKKLDENNVDERKAVGQEKNQPSEVWKPSQTMMSLHKALADLLNENKLKINGVLGSESRNDGEFMKINTSMHVTTNRNLDEADQAVRALHRFLWELIEQKKWDMKGPRNLPENEKVTSFELQYAAESNDGVIACTFTPLADGKWESDQRMSCKLVIKLSEIRHK